MRVIAAIVISLVLGALIWVACYRAATTSGRRR